MFFNLVFLTCILSIFIKQYVLSSKLQYWDTKKNSEYCKKIKSRRVHTKIKTSMYAGADLAHGHHDFFLNFQKISLVTKFLVAKVWKLVANMFSDRNSDWKFSR